MALGSLLIKEDYQCSDEKVVAEIAMNPYLQYFIGLPAFQYSAPFDSSMLTRFRQRITPEMLDWVNDWIIGRDDSDGTPPNLADTISVQERISNTAKRGVSISMDASLASLPLIRRAAGSNGNRNGWNPVSAEKLNETSAWANAVTP